MVRTRFAPSPTGSLHIGGARTALYNYLLAKRYGGSFILRIEDTDKERNTQSSQDQLIQELHWLGLEWDEGPDLEGQDRGDFGPYTQSQRGAVYHKYAQRLLEENKAFYCFASEEAIDQAREQTPNNVTFKFQSPYRDLPLHEAREKLKAGEEAVIRFRNDFHDRVFTMQDAVRGPVDLPSHMIGDFVILRADGSPVYNFCCAIDDALMEITHVLRGEEHLSNTLRQLMVLEALNLTPPTYGHLSLILDQEGKKLSKRTGASSVSDFMDAGYIPEGLLNYLALLGWSDPEHREILSLEEMSLVFSTDRLHLAAPMYDPDKMRWVNFQHLHAKEPAYIWQAAQPFIRKANLELPSDPKWSSLAMSFFHQDFHTLADAEHIFRPFSTNPPLPGAEAMDVLSWPKTRILLAHFLMALYQESAAMDSQARIVWLQDFINPHLKTPICSGDLSDWAHAISQITPTQTLSLDTVLEDLAQTSSAEEPTVYLSPERYTDITKSLQKELDIKGKALFMPIRVGMIASPHGPDLKLVIQLIPLDKIILRVEYALVCSILFGKDCA